MPARRRDPVSVPRTFHSSTRPHRHDYGIDESISRAGFFSNAVLEDTDAAAAYSRAKDYDLLRNTHSAITASETHSTPRAAVASMKARASSVPPKVQARPARLQQQLVNRPKVAPSIVYVSTPPVASPNPSRYASTPVVQHSEVPWRIRASSVQPEPRARRAGSVPPRPVSYHPGIYEPEPKQPLGTEGLKAHRSPVVLRRSRAGSVPPPRPQSFHVIDDVPVTRLTRKGSLQSPRPYSYYPVEKQAVGTEGLRAHRPPTLSRMSRAQSMGRLPRKPLDFGVDEVELERSLSKAKAKYEEKKPRFGLASRATSEPPHFIAPSSTYPIIGDVLQRPRVRQLFVRRGQVSPSMLIGKPGLPPIYVPSNRAKSAIFYESPLQSAGLQSSRPPLPKPTERRAIRTVDGFTKPKNVMSWEHRLESRISPNDLIYEPQKVARLRDQIRGAQEKMDRHRQLLDRFLDPDMKPASSLVNKNTNFSSFSSSAGFDPNNAPMSDLRRRLRRTLAKTKNDP